MQNSRRLSRQRSIMPSATPHRIDPPSFVVPRVEAGERADLEGARQRPRRHQKIGRPTNPVSLPDDFSSTAAKNTPVTPRVDSSHRPDPIAHVQVSEPPTIDHWLGLHAADLIQRLQHWEADLEIRETELNARSALQDHLQRQFRIQRHELMAELARLRQSLRQLRAELDH